MLKEFRMARIFNIDIELHWSHMFLFGFMAWILVDWFEKALPQSHVAWHWLAAILTAILFSFSILFHEMAHSLVAKKFGIPMRRIILLILGGLAQPEPGEEFKSPKQEFWVAIVGPVSSIFLAAIFIIFLIFLNFFLPQLGYFIFALTWLFVINIFLAAFNIIPIFPMDGGRVFRSFLWWKTKNIVRATKIAAYLTVVLSILLTAGTFLWLGLFSALWLGFICLLFIIPAAWAEYEAVKQNNNSRL